jgi:FMNH2-dependent dimethyl sulfone monooxygenase
MHFGLYAPIPMATVGSPQTASSDAMALSPLPEGVRDPQMEHSADLLMTADRNGFDLCLFAERHLGSDLSAWILAGAIASRFENMRALVAIHPGLLDPVLTAKMSASLDRMCKGRMALNVVNGWFDEEFTMFGGEVLRGPDRYQRSKEFIEILRGLWENESFSIDGQFYQLKDAKLLLKPATPTPPEIFSVSFGDDGREFVAETCDWWFINYPKEAETTDDVLRAIEDCVKDMSQRAERLGRKMRFGINPFVALGTDEETAIEETIQTILKYDPDGDVRKLKRRMLPNTKAGCMGTPEQVVKQIRRFHDLGLDLVLCKLIPTSENVERIGQEVVTPLRPL